MSILKQKQIIAAVCLSFLILVPSAASARGLVPCGGYTDNGQRERACNVTDFFVLIARATNYLIGAAGVYAVFQIVNAGFWLVVSNGEEDSIKKNKQGLTNAIVGFVIVMMSFMLINTVVNFLLASKCKIDLVNPLSYLKKDACTPNPNIPSNLK